jgi:hypothetical protein
MHPAARDDGSGRVFPQGLRSAYHTGWRQENITPKAGNQPLVHGWCFPCGEIAHPALIATGYHVVPRATDLTTDAPDVATLLLRFRFGSGDQQGIDDLGLEIDPGCVFTPPANDTISADIVYPVDPALDLGTFQPAVTIRVAISIGTRAPQGLTIGARRTIKVGTIAGGGNASAIFPIPNVFIDGQPGANWSASVYFANNVLAAPTLTLEQFLDGAGAIMVSQVTIGKTDAALVPIVYGARFFRVVNPNAAASTQTRVIFPLKF